MKIENRFLTRLAAWLLVRSIRCVYWTVRKRQEVCDPDLVAYDPDVKGRYLYCVWHDSIVFPLFHGRPQHMAAIVSGHQDGSYLAESMRFLNVLPVRGSSSKGGTQALRDALTTAKTHHITITPDGPRGPRREMKDGIIYLAAKSGCLIVPMAFRCSNAWRFRGKWTDLVIPKPFSTVTICLARPLQIPPKVDREALVRHTEALQRIMDVLYERAEGDGPLHLDEIGCEETRSAA